MNRVNSTHFATQEELAGKLTSLDLKDKNFPIGGIPLLGKGDKVYVDATDSHTMVFGATGSKKTRLFAMPGIGIFVRGGESFVATDPKGELYERTAGDVSDYGYDVKCMNLRDFKEGFSWNPLTLPYEYYHADKKAKACEFIMEMAAMIIGGNSSEDTFWVDTGRDVLIGLMLLLFEEADKEECNLRSLVGLWNSYLKERKTFMKLIKEKYMGKMIYQKLSSLDNQSDKTAGSIEAFINMGLNKITINEEFMDFLSGEGEDLEEIVSEQMAIYLVIPDENKTYHFVVSLFLEQLYEVLISRAQKELNQKLPRRVNFLIDEFGNIPKIVNMESMITAARSRNIRFHLIVQGMKQLRQKYQEGAEIISGNCNNWIYLYSKEVELLQEISRLCGEVIYDNHITMPLFSEFDLQHLSKESGEALVLAGRNCPCISNLMDIDDYPFVRKELPVTKMAKVIGPVRVFRPEMKKDYLYSHPLDPLDIFHFCGMKMPEETMWVVGTGPDGMILTEGFFTERQIRSEYAFYKLLEKENLAGYANLEDLEWYSAERQIENRYQHWMKQHPGIVTPDIDILGNRKFTLRRKGRFQPNGKYRMKAQLWDEQHQTEAKVILDEEIKDYEGMVGLQYVQISFFRRMNGLLEGTPFEKIAWKKFEGEGDCADTIYYVKKIHETDYVVGSIEKIKDFRQPYGFGKV